MKILLLAIVAITAVATLSGCATSRSPFTISGQIYKARTPSKEICKQAMGKTVAEAEVLMKVGEADDVKLKLSGEETRFYSKGNLKVELYVNSDGKVAEANCITIVDK